jgi:hypothetical protein
VAKVRRAVGRDHPVLAEPGKEFVQVDWGSFEPPRKLLQRLSDELGTDVTWLMFQSTVDAFAFEHWNCGERSRTLVFGCSEQGTRECVEGTPEAWEPAEVRDGRAGECSHLNSRETARRVAEHYGFSGW